MYLCVCIYIYMYFSWRCGTRQMKTLVLPFLSQQWSTALLLMAAARRPSYPAHANPRYTVACVSRASPGRRAQNSVVLCKYMSPYSCVWAWSLHVLAERSTSLGEACCNETAISFQSLVSPSNTLNVQGKARITRLLTSGRGETRGGVIPNRLHCISTAGSRALGPPTQPGLRQPPGRLGTSWALLLLLVAEAALSQCAGKALAVAPGRTMLPSPPHPLPRHSCPGPWTEVQLGVWICMALWVTVGADTQGPFFASCLPLAGFGLFRFTWWASFTRLNGKEFSQFQPRIVFWHFIQLQVSWESPMKTQAVRKGGVRGKAGISHESRSWQRSHPFHTDDCSSRVPCPAAWMAVGSHRREHGLHKTPGSRFGAVRPLSIARLFH